jgi:hypothetical protein
MRCLSHRTLKLGGIIVSEKEKRKHGEQKQAPFWLYSVLIFVSLISSISPSAYLLRAYPYFDTFVSLSIPKVIGLTILLILVFIAGAIVEKDTRRRKFLILSAIGILFTSPVMGILLIYLSYFIAPITFVILVIYSLGLIARRFQRYIYTKEALGLLGLAVFFMINLIITNWTRMRPYDVVNSKTIGDDTYHLILHSCCFDPTFIELHKCNHMGFLCNAIYAPNDYYYDYDEIDWQITEDDNTTITIFVNNEAIHTEIISESN